MGVERWWGECGEVLFEIRVLFQIRVLRKKEVAATGPQGSEIG